MNADTNSRTEKYLDPRTEDDVNFSTKMTAK